MESRDDDATGRLGEPANDEGTWDDDENMFYIFFFFQNSRISMTR